MRSNSVSADYSAVLFKLPEEQPETVVSFVKAGMTLTSMTYIVIHILPRC